MGPNTHRSRSISDVLSFSTVSVLGFDPIRVRALYVEEPQLRCISSGFTNNTISYRALSHILPLAIK